MDHYTADELEAARAPLASLLSKSEKARQKLAPGTWQHTMLGDNIEALRIGVALLGKPAEEEQGPSPEQLRAALEAFASMIERTAATQMKFAPGSSQHSLQSNRLHALRVAESLTRAQLRRIDG